MNFNISYFMNELYQIDDSRNTQDFKMKTFSGFKKTDVMNAVLKSIETKKIENACYWASECIVSGYVLTLWEKLIVFSSKIVHINNRQRLIRALEIYECTGKSPSEHFQAQYIDPAKTARLYTIFLKWERASLNKRIEERTKDMFNQGWIEEVENLLELQKNQKKIFSSLNSIGYKHIKSFLNNEISEKEMFEIIYIRTRQLARRQEKWFKKEPVNLFIMMDSLRDKKIFKILDCFVKRIS